MKATRERDDRTLVEAFRSGETGAFDELFERHWRSIYRVSCRLVRDEAAAEDVTQEVFVIAFRKLAEFRGESLFSTWLHRIAVNRALGWNRKSGRLRETELEEAGAVASSGPEAGSSAAVEQVELREALWQAVEELPPKQRAIFLLRTGEEMPFAEIAAMLGKSVGGSKANFHLAVRNLRRKLAPYMKSLES